MKTKFFKVGKRTLSVVLSLMMLASSVFVGSSETVADAASDTSAGYSTTDVAADDSIVTESSKTVEETVVNTAEVNSLKKGKLLPNSSGSYTNGTIKVRNTNSWNNVNIYAWYKNNDDDVVVTSAWPGDAMKNSGNNIFTHSFNNKVPDTVSTLYVIFNNGTAQTNDIKIDNFDSFDFNNSVLLTGLWYAYGRPYGESGSWNGDYTSRTSNLFTFDGSVGKYRFEPNKTMSVLNTGYGCYIGFSYWPTNSSTGNTNYGPSSATDLNDSNASTDYSITTGNTNKFHLVGSTEKIVTYWIDTSDFSNPKFSFTFPAEEEEEEGDWYLYNFKNSVGDTITTVDNSVKFDQSQSDSNLYVYETGMDMETLKSNTGSLFFYLKRANTSGTSFVSTYAASTKQGNSGYRFTGSDYYSNNNATVTLKNESTGTIYEMSFKNVTIPSAKTGKEVVFYIDTTNSSSPKFYYDYGDDLEEEEEEPATGHKIYFDDITGYSTPYAYIFANDQPVKYAWPGKAMKHNRTKGLYYYVLDDTEYNNGTGIIFNNGSTQTANLDFVKQTDSMVYNIYGCTGLTDEEYTSMYIMGRFSKKENGSTILNFTDSETRWNSSNAYPKFVFKKNKTTGVYDFDTGSTYSELSATYYDTSANTTKAPQYFYFWNPGTSTTYKYTGSDALALSLSNSDTQYDVTSSGAKNMYFDGSSSYNTGHVVLHFNPTTNKFWYTIEDAAKPSVTINPVTYSGSDSPAPDLTGVTVTVNNLSSNISLYEGVSATVKVSGIPTGYTADVTVTKADSQSSSGGDGYSSTGISKKMSKKTLNASGDTAVAFTSVSRATNEYTFTMPTSNVEVSVAIRNLNTYTIETAEVDTNNIGTINSPTNNSTAQEGSNVSLSATVTNSALYNVTWSIQKKVNSSYTTAVEGTDYTVTSGYDANSLTNTIQPYANLKITATFAQVAYTYSGNLRLYWRENKDVNAGPSDVINNSTQAALYYDNQGRIFANFEAGGGNTLKKTTYYFASTNGTDTSTVPTREITIDADDDVVSAFGLTSDNKTAQVSGNNVTMYFLKATTTSATSLNVYIGSGTFSNGSISGESLYTENGSRKYTVTGTWETAYTKADNEVTVYAKTGTIRDSNEGCYDKYAKLSTVSLKYSDNSSLSYGKFDKSYTDNGGGNRLYKAYVQRNKEITITIQLKKNYKDLYYVKAFCINGDSKAIIEASDAPKDSSGNYTGTYTCTYTVTDDDPEVIEITPIYYYFAQTGVDYITLKVENFAGEVSTLWGNTIACYAYYADGKDTDTPKNALGGYPGQPMVKVGSSYYMQIPRTDGTAGTVKGITLNNYVWDDIHGVDLLKYKEFNGLYSTLTGDNKTRSGANCQTYDYDDFTALAALDKNTYLVDNIVFNFKYRKWNSSGTSAADKGNVPYIESGTTTAFGTGWAETTVNSTYNGWDVLTDYYDYPINIFGTRLDGYSNKTSDATTIKNLANDEKLFIVSDGYENYYKKNNATGSRVHDDYIGEYGTKWYVYTRDASGKFTYIAALPPSAFIPSYSGYLDTAVQTAVQSVLGDSTTSDSSLPYAKLNKDNLKTMPVVITYESALYSGGRQNSVSRKGLRCDGRWYFSKTSENVSADVEIHILDSIDSNGKITAHKDNFIVEDDTTTNQGTTTLSKAYFVNTNEVTDGAISTGDVSYSTTDYFHFQAQQSSVGTDGYTYVFVGWYTESGDGVYNPVNNVEEGYGSELRDSNNTFIAMYKKETTSLLSISHLPLSSDSPSDTSKPTVGAGSGKTLAKVRIYDKDADITTAEPVKTINTTPDEINISQGILGANYLNGNYKIEIDLTTVPDDGSVYDSTSKYDSGAESGSKYTSQNITNTIEISATDLSSWFGTGESKITKNLVYYSKFNQTTMLVTYHYFDRKNPANEPNDIRPDATDVTVKVSYSSKDTPADIIARGLNSSVTANGDVITAGKLSNILDEYVIWTTQAQASGGEGILGMVNYHDKNDSSYYNYGNPLGTYTSSTYDYTKHTNYIGVPALKTAAATEKWITYYSDITNSNDKTEYTPASGISSEADYDKSQIKEISVWAYNVPKQYPISFVYPKESGKDATPYLRKNTDFGATINSKLPSDVYYIDLTANNIPDNAATEGGIQKSDFKEVDQTFYNQRIGIKYYIELTKEEKETYTEYYNANTDGVQTTYTTLEAYLAHEREVKTDNDARNTAGTHISLYGVDEGYTNTKVTALSTATAYVYDAEGNKTYVKDTDGNDTEVPETVSLVFDGWYDVNTGIKLTSDADYGYRVTADLDLVAGYKPAGTKKQLGVSVSENERDYYIAQGSDNSLVEKIRFNTQLNVYDSVENNKDIAKTAVVYVLLKVTGNDGLTTAKAYEVANTEEFITALRTSIMTNLNGNKSSGSIEWTIDGTEVIYAYEVIFTYVNGTPGEGESALTLNNKNRAEFTLFVNASDYNENGGRSAILAFGGVKLNSQENWILSDNCIKYINYTPTSSAEP